MTTLVMKFGGAAVASPQRFSAIADLILARRRTHNRIVIVVSAMGDTTNRLIELAKEVNPTPPQREYDMLLTVGERISISLLAMALAAKNCEAISFTGSQSGIITCSRHTNARIVDVKPHRILKSLEMGKIVIVAGFQGVSREGDITTLGRGGSDTTAVALGVALQAERVEFYKDVLGIYEEDPKVNPKAARFETLSYQQAMDIVVNKGARVLHDRSIELARKNQVPLYILSFHEGEHKIGSVIGDALAPRPEMPFYEETVISKGP